MPTLELVRKLQPTRRPVAAMSDVFLQAVMALCFALMVVAIVASPTADAPDSAVFAVAGP